MKKVLSLLLVLALTFTICACSNEDKLVGTWKCNDADITITFNEDGTAIYNEEGDKEIVEWLLVDGVIVFDGYETDLTFKDGQLLMNDGGEISKFVKE